MKSFDDWMDENYSGQFDMPHPRDAYEAGQQSIQAEIDMLQEKLKGCEERALMMFNHKNAMNDIHGSKIDELQKRIDDAHRELKYINSSIWEETVTDTINILKGKNQ